MLSFLNDYSEGTHEKILENLLASNRIQEPGYGFDSMTQEAKHKIAELCGCDWQQIFLLTGGTQTNQIVIDSLLSSYEGVISASSGHINIHEAGAIEFGGHKVLSLEASDGKLEASRVRDYIESFYHEPNHEHMVFPGMVFISFPTELGTLYTRQELSDLFAVCQDFNIPLYIDGARLGYGLMSDSCDLNIKDIAELCNVFYIGGTKIGALCGEALVFTKNNMPAHFFSIVKQHGALLAKGRLLGIQFASLFTDNLYFELSRHAIEMANKLKAGFLEKGYRLFSDSPTNQQFIILDNKQMKELEKQVRFSYWEKYDDRSTVARFVTSWATTEESVNKLLEII